jgi:hypothetical protein
MPKLMDPPWSVPGIGAQDPPPALTLDEQIRTAALAAVARMFQGKPCDPDIAISHAARYERWIRTGIENPGRTVGR